MIRLLLRLFGRLTRRTIAFLVLCLYILSTPLLASASFSFSSSSKQEEHHRRLEENGDDFNFENITNPYFGGCLQQKLKEWQHKPRVCSKRHKDDKKAMELGLCRPPPFSSYMEIRIATGNWDSATALGWLVQIILSELLGVPTSIESGMYGSSRDFYDPHGAIDYDTGISPAPLITASELPNGDCLSLPMADNPDDYIQCAHFYPEFWGNPLRPILDQQIEPPQGIGYLGTETWFITKFTVMQYPELVSYHGLVDNNTNNDNKNNTTTTTSSIRQKLASLFKRPTTWKEYCEWISDNNCTIPDSVAQRAPRDEVEANRMFVPNNVYTGYFRYTDKNNCTKYPTNCKGHIANYPCGWSSNMETNLYHMNIPLESNNGPHGSPGGYTADQLKEMWHAANATKSHLIMAWWSPEPLYQQYLGTDAELQRILLKPYTRDCAVARAEWKDECSDDQQIRVGAPEEACDNPVEPLRKLINVGLKDVLESSSIPKEAQSPAYDVLRLFQIEEIQLGELFDLWQSEAYTPRDAICTWAVNNLDVLNATIPSTYPRITQQQQSSSFLSLPTFGYIAITFGSLSTLIIMFTSWSVYQQRNAPSIQYAQLDFLTILLSGSFLVAIGSILLSLPASDNTCLASIWFIHVGYTLELVPLIIKVAAINRMMAAAKELRRIQIRRDHLYKAVALIGMCIITYLIIWSILDPPQRVSEYVMTNEITDHGEHVVGILYHCSGSGGSGGGDSTTTSNAWQFAAVAWNAILLLCASVLAFQTRNVLQRFNESRTLAFLIYSHSVFVVLRISTFLLSDHVIGSTLDYSRSMIYAIDQMATCIIYFLPKLTASRNTGSSDSMDGVDNNESQSIYFGDSGPFSSRRISGLKLRPSDHFEYTNNGHDNIKNNNNKNDANVDNHHHHDSSTSSHPFLETPLASSGHFSNSSDKNLHFHSGTSGGDGSSEPLAVIEESKLQNRTAASEIQNDNETNQNEESKEEEEEQQPQQNKDKEEPACQEP